MSKYRRVEVATWTDGDFLSWTSPQPSGQFLWMYLLTGRRTVQIPGVVIAREAVIADDLGWTIEGFREAFAEVSRNGRVKADWKAGVVLLRRALIDADGNPRPTNTPQSPNVLRSWSKCWRDIPDCDLKIELYDELKAFSEALGEGYGKAFREAWPLPSTHPSRNQDQEKEKKQENHTGARVRVATPDPVATAGMLPVERSRDAHRALADEIWAEQEAELAILRREPWACGSRALGPVHPGKSELAKTISERSPASGIEEVAKDCRHVLAVRLAEAKRDRSLRWFDGYHWSAKRFSVALAMTIDEASRSPRSAHGTEQMQARRRPEKILATADGKRVA